MKRWKMKVGARLRKVLLRNVDFILKVGKDCWKSLTLGVTWSELVNGLWGEWPHWKQRNGWFRAVAVSGG